MFDDDDEALNCEPLDRNAVDIDDDELMREFASTWLGDADQDTLDLMDEVGVADLILEDDHPGATPSDEQALLPSVTDDSYEEASYHSDQVASKRARTTSFDWDLGLDDHFVDMETWANDLELLN